jgi:hypothetical protein
MALLDLLQQLQRVDHLPAVHRGNVEVVRDLGTDGQKYRVKWPRPFPQPHR